MQVTPPYSIVRVVCAPHVGFATYGGFVVSGEGWGRRGAGVVRAVAGAHVHLPAHNTPAALPDAHAVSMLHCALDVPADA